MDSIGPLNARARKGIVPWIATDDSKTHKVPSTLKPDTMNLKLPVLSYQDSSMSDIRSVCWAFNCGINCLILFGAFSTHQDSHNSINSGQGRLRLTKSESSST